MHKNFYKRIIPLAITLLIMMQTGCAYYNTFYNAKQFYKEAEKERELREKTMVVELTEEEKATRKKSGESGNASDKPGQKEMQNYQMAIEKSSKILEYFPNSKYVDDALILLGKCFYYRQEYKKAQRKFQEIQQLYPDSKFIPESELFMAKTYLGLEEYDKAEDEFLAISLEDDFPKEIREEAKYELASLYFEEKKYEQAAENLASASREADDKLIRAMSIYKLGECYIKMDQYDKAVDLFNRSVKVSPNEDFKSQSMFKLGEAQSLMKEYDKAIQTFTKLLNTEFEIKRIPKIKLALADNEQKRGNMTAALKWYENIIEEHRSTDAAAKSYYALGQIEEFQNKDYKKAKENYDQVRSAFANSLIAPQAKERSDNIRMLLELNDEIAKLEGRYVESDSLDENANGENENREQRDDAVISLPANGFWINYAGRHRPPPASLLNLTEADMQRSAENVQLTAAASDSVDSNGTPVNHQAVGMDSTALAEMQAKQEEQKQQQLAEKRLALAEVLYFNFDKPDSAASLYQTVIDNGTDSSLTTRAMYSLGYLYHQVFHDSAGADSVLNGLIAFNPSSPQAAGARRLLGIKLEGPKVDSAKVYYDLAEKACWQDDNPDKAIEYYEYIINNFPESDYVPKAEYARGWVFEHVLFQPDKALETFKNIVSTYPESEYSKELKPKLAAVEKTIKDEEARQAAIADSLQKLEAARQDSINGLNADSLQTLPGDSLAASVPTDSLGNPLNPVVLDSTGQQTAPDSLANVPEPGKSLIPGAATGKRRPPRPNPGQRPNQGQADTKSLPKAVTVTLPADSTQQPETTQQEETILDQ